MTLWIDVLSSGGESWTKDYPGVVFGFFVAGAAFFFSLRTLPILEKSWAIPVFTAIAAAFSAWALWVLLGVVGLTPGGGDPSTRFQLIFVTVVVSTILIYATTVTYNNVRDVGKLRDQMRESLKEHKAVLRMDTAHARRDLRRLELENQQLLVMQITAPRARSRKERIRLLALQYIQQLYKDPNKVLTPEDFGLDTLEMRSEFRQILTDRDWERINELANEFKDSRQELQEQVRASAAQVRALREA